MSIYRFRYCWNAWQKLPITSEGKGGNRELFQLSELSPRSLVVDRATLATLDGRSRVLSLPLRDSRAKGVQVQPGTSIESSPLERLGKAFDTLS